MKIVGISSSIIKEQNEEAFLGYERSYVNEDYIKSVIKNDATPMIIPFNTNDEIIKKQLSSVDALILSGGHDVNPLNYNNQPREKLGQTFDKRDKFDLKLIKYALEKDIPVLGICRGLQILNVYFGGSLYQDLSYDKKIYIKHDQQYNPKNISHTVELTQGSKLYDIFSKNIISVNSFHHQTIDNLADGLIASALSPDGVIEAIEHKDYKFVVGVQWHPEMLHEVDESMNLIFKALIESVGK